jgi:hypothetical protein
VGRALAAVVGCAAAGVSCAHGADAFAGPARGAPALEFRYEGRQAVGVYARQASGYGEVFLRFVAPGAVDTIPLRGFRHGHTLRLRAVTVSGDRSFEADELVVQNGAAWRVP